MANRPIEHQFKAQFVPATVLHTCRISPHFWPEFDMRSYAATSRNCFKTHSKVLVVSWVKTRVVLIQIRSVIFMKEDQIAFMPEKMSGSRNWFERNGSFVAGKSFDNFKMLIFGIFRGYKPLIAVFYSYFHTNWIVIRIEFSVWIWFEIKTS